MDGSDFWDVAANWSSNPALPGSSDDVFNNTASATITHRSGNDTINSFLSEGAFILSGGSLTVNTTLQVNNTFTINGGTLKGATVNAGSGGQGITFANNGSNFLDGVTANANLDLATGTGIARILNGLTLNGIANINNNSVLAFEGTQTLSGTGAVLFGDTGSSNRLDIEGNSTLTIGSNMKIHGQNGTIGGQVFAGGTNALVNNGTISADVSGGTITLTANNGNANAITNGGLLEAANGGTLNLAGHITNTGSGAITVADSDSRITQSAVTVTGGTINNTAGGEFVPSNSSNNYLDGVTVNGVVDMASATGIERILDGLTLNGTIKVNSNSILAFQGDQTLGGTGDILFGDTGSSNRLDIEGNSTLTIGSNIKVHGQNGRIGGQDFIGATNALINNGTISADVSGGTIILTSTNGAATAVTNNNTLEARNGGTLNLSAHVTNGSSGNITVVDSSSTVFQNGVTLTGGTINGLSSLAPGAGFVPSNSSNNYLDGVTVNGVVDMASATGIERILDGLTLNGTIKVN
ncbi:MAG TPA: hypothetical protein VFB21_04660, partial [Chthonomonadaceae bacterium]|nr:hypothetical protein [Chthonomonadaceae bacterium]